jgi:hypothetical protein
MKRRLRLFIVDGVVALVDVNVISVSWNKHNEAANGSQLWECCYDYNKLKNCGLNTIGSAIVVTKSACSPHASALRF